MPRTLEAICTRCNGSGMQSKGRVCRKCGGTGRVQI